MIEAVVSFKTGFTISMRLSMRMLELFNSNQEFGIGRASLGVPTVRRRAAWCQVLEDGCVQKEGRLCTGGRLDCVMMKAIRMRTYLPDQGVSAENVCSLFICRSFLHLCNDLF